MASDVKFLKKIIKNLNLNDFARFRGFHQIQFENKFKVNYLAPTPKC